MKNLVLILIVFGAFSCEEKTQKNVAENTPQIFVSKQSKFLKIENGILYFKNKKFDGYLFEMYPDSKDSLSIEGFMEGILSGVTKKWYPNHLLLEERYFAEGQKNGKQVSYWDNGKTRFEFVAKNDQYEGELKEYSYDGKLFHLATYKNGQEEGTQKMWYDNGKIKANYFIINGKRYGLLGTKNCKNVSDSVFVVK